MRCDFHLHTHFSDGTLSPADLVGRLLGAGVDIFSITDHDTMKAYGHFDPPASARFIVGVEINTKASSELLHILAFGGKLLKSASFKNKLETFRAARRARAQAICERLNRVLAVPITLEDVLAQAKESIGRPNIADALVKKNLVKNRQEAFQRYLLKGRPGYAPPMGPTPEEALDSIVSAGATAVLAHPAVAKIDEKKLSSLVDLGLAGIEAYYPTHNASQVKEYVSLAKKYGLFLTFGSDYHGPRSGREELYSMDLEGAALAPFLEAVT